MRSGFLFAIIAVFTLGILLNASAALASFQDDLQTQIFQYATERGPTFYLNSKSVFQTETFLTRINVYYESGTKGTWSVDPDPLRFDLHLDDSRRSFVWLGREHPLNLTRLSPVEATDALGTVWAQNQLNALNPRVSGWIGAGLHQELAPSWTLVLAYSPIFLPSFSPSLGFSETGDIHPARFSRLPPATAMVGGVPFPIRYQLQLGQISDLILRSQYFGALSHDDQTVNMDAFFFSSPKPVPVPLTPANIVPASTRGGVVNVDVQIDPQFPREYWTGFRTQFKEVLFKPAFEFVQGLHDINAHYVSFTGYFDSPQFNPNVITRTTRASFGVLTHLQQQFAEPQFSDLMVFFKLPLDLTNELCFRNMIQATLLTGKESLYWLSELEYAFSSTFSAMANIRILSGVNYSYFGDWRSEDSYSAGLRWIW